MVNWSIEEERSLRTYFQSGMRSKAIARKMDRSLGSIDSKIYQMGFSRKKEYIKLWPILNNVVRYSGIKKAILFSKTRKREIVQYRQLCHYYAQTLTRASLKDIGMYFGDKDHATVLNSKKAIDNLIDTDAGFKKIYEEILVKINRDMVHEENKSVVKVRQKQQILLIKKSLSNIHAKIELNDFIKRMTDEYRG